MSPIRIDEVVIPTSADAPDAADFIRTVEVYNAVQAVGFGTPDLAYEPAEELPYFRDEYAPIRLFAAWDGDLMVGTATYETRGGDEADTAWLGVQVLPEYEGGGIGTRLSDLVEGIARDDGKAKSLAYAPIPEGPGERLAAPTGFGSIVVNRDARFLQRRGYRLEQMERVSRLGLPIADLTERLRAAEEASGADYRVHTWVGSTPERWVEDMAVLATRMSTDAPSAGLEEPEDPWTAERIRERDEATKASPRERLTAAVEHVPTGTLAGYTALSVPQQPERCVQQYATLVLKEHRGHRLGMLIKVANLDFLQRERPGHPSITTFNAEENRFMLDVNEAVGFVPIANESAWRLDL